MNASIKTEMTRVISSVQNMEYQRLLELRYLCFRSWKQIADEMGYSKQHIFRLHNEALEKVDIPGITD